MNIRTTFLLKATDQEQVAGNLALALHSQSLLGYRCRTAVLAVPQHVQLPNLCATQKCWSPKPRLQGHGAWALACIRQEEYPQAHGGSARGATVLPEMFLMQQASMARS